MWGSGDRHHRSGQTSVSPRVGADARARLRPVFELANGPIWSGYVWAMRSAAGVRTCRWARMFRYESQSCAGLRAEPLCPRRQLRWRLPCRRVLLHLNLLFARMLFVHFIIILLYWLRLSRGEHSRIRTHVCIRALARVRLGAAVPTPARTDAGARTRGADCGRRVWRFGRPAVSAQ